MMAEFRAVSVLAHVVKIRSRFACAFYGGKWWKCPWLTLMVFSSKIHALVAILEQFFCQSVRLYAPQIKRAQLSDLHLNGQDRGEPHSCAIMTANMLSPSHAHTVV